MSALFLGWLGREDNGNLIDPPSFLLSLLFPGRRHDDRCWELGPLPDSVIFAHTKAEGEPSCGEAYYTFVLATLFI